MIKSLRSIYKEELNCLRGRWFRNLSGRYGCLRQLAKLFSGHESKQNSELSFGSNKKLKVKTVSNILPQLIQSREKTSDSLLDNMHH